MNLAEVETRCKELYSLKEDLALKESQLQQLEAGVEKAREEAEILRMMAEIGGEKHEGKFESEDWKKVKTEIEEIAKRLKKSELAVLEGLKEFTISLPPSIPEISSEGKATLTIEGEPCENATNYITSLIDSDVPLMLDNVLLYPDKIIVTSVLKPIEAVQALKAFISNITRLARVALDEKDPDVEALAKHFRAPSYREIWEAIKGSKRISNQELYSRLGLKTERDKKRVRNFFTNSERSLKDNFPFVHLQAGTYELKFIGSLAWKRYKEDHLRKEEIGTTETKKEPPADKDYTQKQEVERGRKPEKSTLNDFLNSNETREAIYGRKIK